MTTAAELLAELKSMDLANGAGATAILLLEQDTTLYRLVMSWPNVLHEPDPEPGEELPPATPSAMRFRWLWARREPDPVTAWIATAGLPDAPHIRRACQVAIDQRMVHPDGKLARFIEQYARNAAMRVLIEAAPKTPKPPAARREAPAERRERRDQEAPAADAGA